MSETYEAMRARIQPERYEVIRREIGPVKMWSGARGSYEEPGVEARVVDRQSRRLVIPPFSMNATTFCLPDGHTVSGPQASDEAVILATVGDEPIFG